MRPAGVSGLATGLVGDAVVRSATGLAATPEPVDALSPSPSEQAAVANSVPAARAAASRRAGRAGRVGPAGPEGRAGQGGRDDERGVVTGTS